MMACIMWDNDSFDDEIMLAQLAQMGSIRRRHALYTSNSHDARMLVRGAHLSGSIGGQVRQLAGGVTSAFAASGVEPVYNCIQPLVLHLRCHNLRSKGDSCMDPT